MLRATFAAPPGLLVVAAIDSTGTGLSGDIRFTCPDTKRSSMTSPRHKTRTALSLSVMIMRQNRPARGWSNRGARTRISRVRCRRTQGLLQSLDRTYDVIEAARLAGLLSERAIRF